MADPTVILDDVGEVMRMTNEEGDPKISQVMEAQDLKGNLEEDSSSDFECFIELSEEDLALEFVKLSASDKIQYNEWFEKKFRGGNLKRWISTLTRFRLNACRPGRQRGKESKAHPY